MDVGAGQLEDASATLPAGRVTELAGGVAVPVAGAEVCTRGGGETFILNDLRYSAAAGRLLNALHAFRRWAQVSSKPVK